MRRIAVKEGEQFKVVFCELAYRVALTEAEQIKKQIQSLRNTLRTLNATEHQETLRKIRDLEEKLKEIQTDWREYVAVIGV